ncbi:MAG: acetate--CoA ligase family protein [Alphaproteobacteria bacterium]|nr:acetate--CoA ligase family protein [Alphaproteobacteria bacterium]MBU0797175.1 acetate--CoA ligase family protein [Alphaproteobacteria bacterium]MBU0887154.1 acetate--CoA ligase family protein [Alphaproteobacteria bacterium]MBU1814404.1 acetate--CoA ligase family protein [Alphaproteobacteria bacterium]MBU2089484.1 acetate--CoA ligase family protein [Alphaproteobacteria bacterium]
MSGDLSRLFAPRSVAVIGASGDPKRIGGRPIASMQERGFTGDIWPVNPNRPEVQGLKAYASLADLPGVPDVAIVAVPAALAGDTVADLAQRGVSAAIIFSAGFAEMGGEGEAAQDRLVAAARAGTHPGGMRLLGPNTLGLFDMRSRFYGTFTSVFEGGYPQTGRIGIASQSGAYCGHLVAVMRERGLGIATAVMTGNEADISIGDVIGSMVADPEIDVIAAYAEGINKGDSFVAALEAARRARKPVVVMKVGRSALGGAAAQSHTASIAGDDAVTGAVLEEFGAVQARTTDEMLDIAQLATRRIYPVGNTLGVITVSGGAGVVISDAAEQLGLDMPEMPEAAQARMKEILPYAAPRNPVDTTAQVLNDLSLLGQFGEAMISEGGYRSILGFLTYTADAASLSPRLREQFRLLKESHPDRLYVLSLVAGRERVNEFEADGFTVFEDPTRATVAISAMGKYGEAFARQPGQPALSVPPVALPASNPTEAQAKSLLSQAGIAAAPEKVCTMAEEAVGTATGFGFPVVMKIVSPDILHKTEIGGVLLDITDEAGVRAGFATLLDRARTNAPQARIEGVLVARQLKGGVECILGIHRDPVFGPVAMVGLGGVFVEIMKDVAFRRCPFGIDVAEQMIRSLKGASLLLGARGRPKADIKALAEMLSRLSSLAAMQGDKLQSIDLNPVIVMPEGHGAYAVDAVIEVAGEGGGGHGH